MHPEAPQSEALSDTRSIAEDMRSQRSELISLPFSEDIERIFVVKTFFAGRCSRTRTYYDLHEAIEEFRALERPDVESSLEFFRIFRDESLDPKECDERGIPTTRNSALALLDLPAIIESPHAKDRANPDAKESEIVFAIKRMTQEGEPFRTYTFKTLEKALDYCDWCLEVNCAFYLQTYRIYPDEISNSSIQAWCL